MRASSVMNTRPRLAPLEMEQNMNFEERYLGDGVYASFDGFQFWLDTRAQEPVQRIALEPDVCAAFEAYRAHIRQALQNENPRDG